MTICLNPKTTEGSHAGVMFYTPRTTAVLAPMSSSPGVRVICGCGQPSCRDYKEQAA